MFPQELTQLKQWLVWRFEPNGDKKPRKVPYYANGTRRHGKQGDKADRDALTSYEKAKSALEYGYQGLGFAFLPDDGLIGIDIDANADKELAAKIIGGCNSYTELSPSGNGWHIFVKGETKTFKDNDVGIEVFCSSQFFTMTGDKIPESPDTIAPISDKLINRLREIVKPEKPKPTRTSLPINERAKVESALAYINADCGYDDWYKIGMAIYSELGAGGFSVWDYWSAKSSKYSPKGMQEKYASFAGSAVKGATLYGMAIDNGWQPPRDPNYRPTQQQTQPKPTQQPTPPVSIDLFSPLVDVNDKGKPLETIENLADVCRRLGINITYNVISKSVDIAIPNNKTTIDNEYNANLAMLKSWCKRFKMPTDSLKDYVLAIADGNVFNPVQTWIESVLWDKKPRLNEFFATVSDKTKKILPDGRSLKDVLIFRWMLSAVAVALTEKPIAAQGVLTFTGKGNLGKTEWFKNLLPEEMRFLLKEGLTLNPSDKDSVTTCISHWLCELGELDGTFRRADVAQLKAFITRSQDDVRRPYAASDSKYPRRTVLFASVNSREYLQDPTGNRRFWTVEVDKINARHGMNMQQVWAEVAYCYRDLGQKWFLEPDEMEALNDHNDDFMSINPTHEKIDTAFEWEQSPVFWTHPCTATEIAELSGVERITQRETNEASSYVQQRYAVQTKRIGANKNKRWMMPPLTFEAEQALAKRSFKK